MSDQESRIVQTPGICGGAARIRGTRIPVSVLSKYARRMTDSEILKAFPQLQPEDLVAAWQYAEQYLQERGQRRRGIFLGTRGLQEWDVE